MFEKHAMTLQHIRAVATDIARQHAEANENSVPVVFVSVYEHNSNLLPWRESGARIVVIPNTSKMAFDYEALERELKAYENENCLKRVRFLRAQISPER